jgi:amino acid transporter
MDMDAVTFPRPVVGATEGCGPLHNQYDRPTADTGSGRRELIDPCSRLEPATVSPAGDVAVGWEGSRVLGVDAPEQIGWVAALALGLAPIVFILTGALFYCTATTYAEATAMYPEAGGSSLFARQAFNEFWSFFTAWAQMLNYVITIAISAFFAAHYAGGVVTDWFSTPPGDIVFGIALIVLLALVNVRGVRDAVSVNVVLAVIDFLSQLTLVVAGIFLVLNPEVLRNPAPER